MRVTVADPSRAPWLAHRRHCRHVPRWLSQQSANPRDTEASRDETPAAAPVFSLLPLGLSIALPSRGQEQLNKTPVLWEPIVRSTTPQPQHTRTKQANSDGEIEWELVPKSKTANELPTKSKKLQAKVVWSLVPETPQLAETTPATKAGAPASAQKVVWEVIPGSINPLGPTPSSTLATKESAGSDKPPADAVAFEDSQSARRIPAPPPRLPSPQSLIAFGDGSAGPTLAGINNGFLGAAAGLPISTCIAITC